METLLPMALGRDDFPQVAHEAPGRLKYGVFAVPFFGTRRPVDGGAVPLTDERRFAFRGRIAAGLSNLVSLNRSKQNFLVPPG